MSSQNETKGCPVEGCDWPAEDDAPESRPDHIVEAHGKDPSEKRFAPGDDGQLTLTGATDDREVIRR